MNVKIVALSVILNLVLFSHNSIAGVWQYGCTGTLSDKTTIFFNRDFLVISDSNLIAGKVKNLEQPIIETYGSEDINSGFAGTISFIHNYGDGSTDKIILNETSSTETYSNTETVACTGNRGRDIIHTNYLKNYDVQLKKSDKKISVKLKCFEFSISTCG